MEFGVPQAGGDGEPLVMGGVCVMREKMDGEGEKSGESTDEVSAWEGWPPLVNDSGKE